MRTVIIGLGNPILSDDGVGIIVSRRIKERLDEEKGGGLSPCDIDIKEIYAGGIRLMDAMTGYDRALVIDAMVTGRHEPGMFLPLSADGLCSSRNLVCTHDTNLNTALELGRMLNVPLPTEVKVWGIEARDVESFSETMTDAVARAVPRVVDAIIQDLSRSNTEGA